MTITYGYTRHLWKTFGKSYSGGSEVAETIAASFNSLGFNKNYTDVIGSYLVTKQPTISGLITDETPNRKTRTELTARATSFSTNQRLYGGNTSTGKTALSVSVWVRPTALAGLQTILGEWNGTGDERAYRLYFNGTKLEFFVTQDGTTSTRKDYISVEDFTDGTPYYITVVLDVVANTLQIYVNGHEIAVTKTNDDTLTSIFDSSSPFEIGSSSGGATYLEGQIQLPLIWESAITAAEVRDLYLGKYDQVTTPTMGWLLDGVTAYPLTSAAAAITLTAANTPTRYEDPEAPDYLNLHGWNVGNKGRFSLTPTEGDTFEFVVKTTSVDFIILSDESGGTAGVVVDNGSTGSSLGGAAAAFSVDGVDRSSLTRDELHTLICDDIEHTVLITTTALYETNYTYAEWGNYTNWPLENGYLRPIKVNGVPITAADIDFDNTTILAPKRINSNVDSDGAPPTTAHSFGECKRNWQLTDGPCISLNGTNQYGVITNTDDYSSEDWVLSGYCLSSSTGTRLILAQDVGTGVSGRSILGQSTTDRKWFTGIANVTSTFDNITPIIDGREYAFEFSHDASAQSLTLSVTDLVTNVTETETLTSLDMESANGNLVIGSNKLVSGNFWPGKVWGLQLDCTTDPTKSFEVPISDEVATSSKDRSGNGKHIVWQNSPSVSTQDSFFESEANGCSSVPVFVDGVGINSSTVNYDGLKTAVVEIDFVSTSAVGSQILFSNDNVEPFYIRLSSGGLKVKYRNAANGTDEVSISSPTVGDLYQYTFTITEDDDNPTTASSIIVTDRITGAVVNSFTGLDIALSSAAANTGPQFIGGYTDENQSFLGDLYRVRHVAGGVEKLLWTADNYLVNQTDDSAMTETGGTLALKKIPALADGSGLDINGYPLNKPPGAYHHDSQTLLEEFPVTDSGSQRAVGYGASFNGTTARENLGNRKVVDGFDIELMLFSSASTTEKVVDSTNNNTKHGIQITKNSSEEIVVSLLGTGTENAVTSSGGIYKDRWTKVRAVRSSDSIACYVDGVLIDTISVSAAGYDEDLDTQNMYIGGNQFGYADCSVRDFKLKTGSTVLLDRPYMNDVLDRSDNCDHGDGTGITFLTEARATNLNPTISQTNTRAVTTGDRKLIRIGQQ